jgi:hypothetical protein
MPAPMITVPEKVPATAALASTGFAIAAELINWQITPERQRHEWLRTRRLIIAARLRIVVYGHIAFLLLLSCLRAAGWLSAGSQLSACGWLSLCFVSAALLAMEFVHMRLLPATPPRYAVRQSGVTEYDEHGPHAHWDWSHTRCLLLERDQQRPEFQSLVFVMNGPEWLWRLNHFHIPLPENNAAGADSHQIILAVGRALTANGIEWKSERDGTLVLRPATAATSRPWPGPNQ